MKELSSNELGQVSGGASLSGSALAIGSGVAAGVGTVVGLAARGAFDAGQSYTPLQLVGYAALSAVAAGGTIETLEQLNVPKLSSFF